jgi:hypothetical protein
MYGRPSRPRQAGFVPVTDQQIVVLFEREAPAGTHHCEARWKDPSGTVVLSSPVDRKATSRRFGIHWSIALAETVRRGLWAVEAFVDGAPAGTHVFEVKDSVVIPPGRRVLSQAEIYQRATASGVGTIESLGAAGESPGGGPAVALDADRVVTAFPSIDDGGDLVGIVVAGSARELGSAGYRSGLGATHASPR